jgi:multiple sugar transport system substrate-binding protein
MVLFLIIALMMVACGGGAADNDNAGTEENTSSEPSTSNESEEPEAEPEEVEEEEAAPEEEEEEAASTGDRVQIRWFVGLGTGTDAQQVAVQEEVVADFNASQDRIELVMEIIPNEASTDALATQIASGNGPDIIGPVGWGGSNAFFGQYLDLAPYIESSGFDTSIFDPALVDSYQTEEGQVGLPFAVFPAAVYYVPAMFDELGLAYPPANYGDMYELDGEEVVWDWDTFTEVARRLTIDINGNTAIDEGFDRNEIVQVGYSPQWQTHVNYMASYRAGALRFVEGEEGDYSVNYPDEWKEAIRWIYDGIWGDQPFSANGALSGSPEFGNGNLFNSGRAAMAITPLWYTCCLGEFRDAGYVFQAGALPLGDDGEYHGRVDADTFRIWKGTENPDEAFEVLVYLITDGADKLLPVYGALPAIPEKQGPFFEVKTNDYPFVTPETWDVFVAGLAYPDNPSAEQYQPNHTEAWNREQAFFDLILNTPPDELDFDAEWDTMVADVTAIYNR